MADSKKSRRWLHGLAVLVLVPVVLLVLVGLGVYDALHPDATDPTLFERPVRTLAARTAPPVLDARTGCGLTVQARTFEAAQLAGVDVDVFTPERRHDAWSVVQRTGPTGVLVFDDLPCGDALVEGVHSDWAGPGTEEVRLEPGARPEVRLVFGPAVFVVGTVRDPNGDPIPAAKVRFRDEGDTIIEADAAGRYAHRVRLLDMDRSLLTVEADALGFRESSERRWLSRVPYDPTEEREQEDDEGGIPAWMPGARGPFEVVVVEAGDTVELDLELQAAREVRVWCAGLEDDLCNDMLVQCTHPLVPVGGACEHDPRTGEITCYCEKEEGPVAIRGGGESTLVQPDENDAWLDFRSAGRIRGRVVASGAQVTQCDVVALRVPSGLEDVTRGIIAAQKSECDVEGNFEIGGLVDGDWEVVVDTHVAELGSVLRVLEPTRVRPRQTVDVGEVDMLGGGGIEGRVVDGLTGEIPDSAPILAIKRGQGAGRSTPMMADMDSDGTFKLEGLPPGEWELSYFLAPHVKTYVTVEDGAITDGVVVETSDATALETNGFTLGVTDGVLEIREVDPGGPADEAGLMPGDEVDGLLVAGLDMGSHLGEHADDFLQLVLGHWDGPGVTLLVNRDGEALEIELDW